MILLFIHQVGNHIDVATGKWTALDAGIGGGVDSYFEYLVKGAIMFQNTELLQMFNGRYALSIIRTVNKGKSCWLFKVTCNKTSFRSRLLDYITNYIEFEHISRVIYINLTSILFLTEI